MSAMSPYDIRVLQFFSEEELTQVRTLVEKVNEFLREQVPQYFTRAEGTLSVFPPFVFPGDNSCRTRSEVARQFRMQGWATKSDGERLWLSYIGLPGS